MGIEMLTPMFILLALTAAVVVAFACVRRIPEGQAYTLRRVGGHMRTVGAGIHVVVPLLESVAHRIRLLGNVVNVDHLPPAPAGLPYSGQIFYQVLDAERADAVIDNVDALVCNGLPALLGEAANEDGASLNRRIKAELNLRLRERGILITRVQLSAA
jgi:regulator of protease activity HflC (stomatin/prohibitin superfamily)